MVARSRLLRVNLNQMSVLFRQGRNIVHFEYKPALFWKLLILQRATFAILVLTAIAAYSSRQVGEPEAVKSGRDRSRLARYSVKPGSLLIPWKQILD